MRGVRGVGGRRGTREEMGGRVFLVVVMSFRVSGFFERGWGIWRGGGGFWDN